MAVLNNHLEIARLLLAKGANPNADDFWGRSPLWAAVDYRNLDMNNRDQDSPTDNGVDRGPILDFINDAHRRRRQRQRADARGAAEPALAVFPRRRLVGGFHGPDAVSESGALGRHRRDAPAPRARRRPEPARRSRGRRR